LVKEKLFFFCLIAVVIGTYIGLMNICVSK